MMNREVIPISKLEMNKGQVEGLPKNPRFFRDSRFEAMKKSIEDCPEMLDLRELIVYPYGDKYVVIGGNLRLRACKELGHQECPCKVLKADTSVAKLREIASKDNISFGETDMDALLNEWDRQELQFDEKHELFIIQSANEVDSNWLRERLNIGGEVSCITSQHWKLAQDKKCTNFREWLKTNGADVTDIEQGEFKESGTTVATSLIHLTKRARGGEQMELF